MLILPPGASIWTLLREAFADWLEDRAPRLGAALAYYTALSLAPLLLIVIGIASVAFGQEAAQGRIVGELQSLVGDDGARAIQDMLSHARRPSSGVIATTIGAATLLLGAAGVFGQLRDALNTIWEVTPRPGRGWSALAKDRFLSLTMVLGTGFLLLVSLAVTAGIAAAGESLRGIGPGVEVWIGAVVTAALFVVGKFAIGLYLGHASIGSAYGAAGSFVVLLVWVYYSAQVLLFGAELTQVYARRTGRRVEPARGAIRIDQTAATPRERSA